HCGALPRSAPRLLAGPAPSSYLVCTPVGFRLCGLLCPESLFSLEVKFVRIRIEKCLACAMRVSLMFALFFCACAVRAQGPAPETAPPFFPGGGLISYNSIFTT